MTMQRVQAVRAHYTDGGGLVSVGDEYECSEGMANALIAMGKVIIAKDKPKQRKSRNTYNNASEAHNES